MLSFLHTDLPDEFKQMEEFSTQITEEIRANTYDNFPVSDYQLDIQNLKDTLLKEPYLLHDAIIRVKDFLSSCEDFIEDVKRTKDRKCIKIFLLEPRTVLCKECNKEVTKNNWIKHFDHQKE